MSPFIPENTTAGESRGLLSRWSHALGFLHAIGCASGLTFFL